MTESENQESVKDRLLNISFEMLRSGVGELSSREVARQAGVNAAMINYHFGSREGLIQACVDSYYTQIRENLVALVPQYTPQSFPTLLESAIRETLTFMRANRALARQVLLDFVRHGHMRQGPRDTEDPLLSTAVQTFSSRLNVPAIEIRYRIKTIVLLCGRYVVIDDDEFVRISQADNAEDAWKHLEDHIVSLAKTLLC